MILYQVWKNLIKVVERRILKDNDKFLYAPLAEIVGGNDRVELEGSNPTGH